LYSLFTQATAQQLQALNLKVASTPKPLPNPDSNR